jgi:hypothetical protein
MTTTKQLVFEATPKLVGAHDVAALDPHFSPIDSQHSRLAAPGIAHLCSLVLNLLESFRPEPARIPAGSRLVVVHGVYHAWGTRR